nr:30S ribosomal protein S19, small subunit ribosomal protein S19 [uncultured archaeon]
MIEIQKKQFIYRGKSVEELKELEVREFAKYLPSRQKRSALRNFQMIEDFVKRAKIKLEKGKKIRTHNRDIIIVPQMIGMNIQIHNGKTFNPIVIEPEMLGHRLGEMSGTRSKVAHSKAGIGATKGTKHKAKK